MFVIWLLKVTAKIERHTAKHQVYKRSSNCLFSFEIRILVKKCKFTLRSTLSECCQGSEYSLIRTQNLHITVII